MTVKKLGPLNWMVPIVDSEGRPTPEFIRYFQQLLSNDGTLDKNITDTTAIADAATAEALKAKGRVGPDGQDGLDGQDGISIIGPQGPIGATGAAGLQGSVGQDGLDGEDGITIPGPTGPTGAAGAAGATGPTGPQGSIGLGIDGEPGEDGISIPGAAGVAGATGAAGAAGATGPQGPIGLGLDGQDGEEGIPGFRGTTGATGVPGPTGIGLDGDDGRDGMPMPGSPGPAGAAGSTGATGPAGPIGIGLDGQDGEDGPRGLQGATGATGTAGSTGPAGPIGIGLDGDDGRDGMLMPGPAGTPGGFQTLATNFANAGNTTTTETDIFTYTVAANKLFANGDQVEAMWSGIFVSSGTATRQLRAYFGGTLILDTGALTVSLAASWVVFCNVMRVSATVIRYAVSMTTEGAALAAYTAVGEVTGLTLANTNIIKITGTAAGVGAATNDIVGKVGSVSFCPAP